MQFHLLRQKCIISALLAGVVLFSAMLILDYCLSGNFQGIPAYGIISMIASLAYYRMSLSSRASTHRLCRKKQATSTDSLTKPSTK